MSWQIMLYQLLYLQISAKLTCNHSWNVVQYFVKAVFTRYVFKGSDHVIRATLLKTQQCFIWHLATNILFLTCTTGVPKFSGSVRGRWSKVCKKCNRNMYIRYLSRDLFIHWFIYNVNQLQIKENNRVFHKHLAFVKMSLSFQTQGSPSQSSLIAIIKDYKRKSTQKRYMNLVKS